MRATAGHFTWSLHVCVALISRPVNCSGRHVSNLAQLRSSCMEAAGPLQAMMASGARAAAPAAATHASDMAEWLVEVQPPRCGQLGQQDGVGSNITSGGCCCCCLGLLRAFWCGVRPCTQCCSQGASQSSSSSSRLGCGHGCNHHIGHAASRRMCACCRCLCRCLRAGCC